MPKKNNASSRVPNCHPERKHCARGLCKTCYDRAYLENNRTSCNEKKRLWAARNPARRLAIRRKYLYGVDTAMVQARLNAQDGLCKICLVSPATHLDHNHATGLVRSLLCGECNRALGLMREDRNRILRMVRYLELWDDRCIQVVRNTGRRADGVD